MNERKSGADLKRRGFLLAGSVGAAGAVAVAVAPSVERVVPVAVASPKTGDVGYHDSEHVRTYYDLARI
jgi:hypothetical protein